MIASADTALQLVNAQTKVIPGHGPLGDKASLGKYRDMMVTVRDRYSEAEEQRADAGAGRGRQANEGSR